MPLEEALMGLGGAPKFLGGDRFVMGTIRVLTKFLSKCRGVGGW